MSSEAGATTVVAAGAPGAATSVAVVATSDRLIPAPSFSPRGGLKAAGDEQRQVSYRNRYSRWQGHLAEEFGSISTDGALALRSRLEEVRAAAEEYISTVDPRRQRGELKDWLDRSLEAVARENHDAMVDAVRQLSVRSARHLALDRGEVIDPPPCRAVSDIDLAPLSRTASDKNLSAVVAVCLRAYMGFMIFFVVSRSTGLGLPPWLGLGPVLFLAGVAMHDERRRRIVQRRSRAVGLMTRHVATFGDRTGRASHELARRLERRVEGAYRGRVDRLAAAPPWM